MDTVYISVIPDSGLFVSGLIILKHEASVAAIEVPWSCRMKPGINHWSEHESVC